MDDARAYRWFKRAADVPNAPEFPRRFAAVSKRGVPAQALIISSILITILLVMNYSGSSGLVEIFEFIILLATLTTLVPYAFCALAELLIYFQEPARCDRRRLIGSGVIGAVAFIYAVWTVFGSGPDVVIYGFILLLLGMPVYVWLKREQAAIALGTATSDRSDG